CPVILHPRSFRNPSPPAIAVNFREGVPARRGRTHLRCLCRRWPPSDPRTRSAAPTAFDRPSGASGWTVIGCRCCWCSRLLPLVDDQEVLLSIEGSRTRAAGEVVADDQGVALQLVYPPPRLRGAILREVDDLAGWCGFHFEGVHAGLPRAKPAQALTGDRQH